MNIIDIIQSEEGFKPFFHDLKTWSSWICFLKSLYGLPLNDDEYGLYQNCTKRTSRPDKPFNEAYCVIGRRGGKSFIASVIACYLAMFGGFEEKLSVGERAFIFCIATDKEQAKIVLNYVRAILRKFPGIIERELAESIELKNNIVIAVKTCSFKAGRGYTTAGIILDELAFYRSEESVNPAEEVIASLLPALLPNGLLLGITSAYGKFGYCYDIYKENFGRNSDILIWQSSTQTMNPTFRQSIIDRLVRRDPIKMTAEFSGCFRDDIESFLPEEVVERITGNYEILPYQKGYLYKAFCDPSAGRSDSMTLAIAHKDNGKVIIDRVAERRSPFDPEMVCREFVEILNDYKVSQIKGDKFAGNWVTESFRKLGVFYETESRSKSQLYLEFQAVANMNKVTIPQNKDLKMQLLSLERSVKSGGYDSVDHPIGLRDDLSNVVAGVSVVVYKDLMGEMTPDEMKARLPVKAKPEKKESLEDELFKGVNVARPVKRPFSWN